MSDSFRNMSDLLEKCFVNMSDKDKDSVKVASDWRNIVMKIHSENSHGRESSDIGSQLADHSKIIDIKNGTVFVETDHPARLQLFHMYKNYLLTVLKNNYHELGIKSISFFMKKDKKSVSYGLRDVTGEEIEKSFKKTDEQEEISNDNNKEVNEEVKKLFSNFFS